MHSATDSRQAWPSPPVPPLPRAPVLDWTNFHGGAAPAADIVSIQNLPSLAYTTSGRAAIFHALRQMALPPGSTVLLPTYHCPTMVAPVLRTGHLPAYFGLRADGLPDLDELDRRGGSANARALIAAHYFGLPRSMAVLRQWCDERSIALIEDCAHCYFGQAGDRAVGGWGDYATASLSKFFPVPEAGLLGAARHPIAPLQLAAPSARAQVKGCVDVLEFAARHDRLSGLRQPLALMFALKNRRPKAALPAPPVIAASSEEMMLDCDMSRVEDAPLWASMALSRHLPRARIVRRRRENYAMYGDAFAQVPGARPLFAESPGQAVPYVFPLWVDDADRVYSGMRSMGLPVFRWDRIWPGTPALAGDAGAVWSRHVLQLLCHQDLRPQDIAYTVQCTLRLLS